MIIAQGHVLKHSKSLVIFTAILVVLGIGIGDGAPVVVSTEAELHAALWNANVTDIILLGQVHVNSTQLWSQQPTTLPTRRPSPPVWARQTTTSNRPVPIRRELQIRGNVNSDTVPELSPGEAGSLRLPLLDLSGIKGWLRLFPNASLRLKGLHLSSKLSADQLDLRPYRALLSALLAPSPEIINQQQQPLLTAVSLEGCFESINVGLSQSMAAVATRDLPTLPSALAAAATSVATAAAASETTAWAALPTPPDATVQLHSVNESVCLNSDSNGEVGAGGSSGAARGRRARETLPEFPLSQGALQPQNKNHRQPGTSFSSCPKVKLQLGGFMYEAWCWLGRIAPSLIVLTREWMLDLARVRQLEPCPILDGDSGGGYASGEHLIASSIGDRVGRMALTASVTASDANTAEGGAVCLSGSIFVNSLTTAMVFPPADDGSGLIPVTDDLLASDGSGWANRTVDRNGGNSNGLDYNAGQATSPMLLLLIVANSYSAPMAQLDEACLRSGETTVAACVEHAVAAQIIKYLPPSPIPPPPLAPEPVLLRETVVKTGAGFQIGLWVLLAAAAILLLALALVLHKLLSLQRRHIQEQGAQRAPGVGPLTTLLITDIANSTGLWESLPEEVMDQALKLHHACLRALLVRFNGYESATEGDSFILAFHYPVDAAKFALSAQVQLMDVMWPAEVLAHPDGQEVWVVPRSAELANGGSLHHTFLNASAQLNVEMDGTIGASMSVQRSSGAIMAGAVPGGGITYLRGSDVGYGSSGAAAVATSSGFLRSSWTGRGKSSKAVVPNGPHSTVRPSGMNSSGLRSSEIDRLSASELEADEIGYAGESRTGSGMLHSFTSRMSTMLGLLPIGGSGGVTVAIGSRPSSRVGRFLRMTSILGKSPDDYNSSSMHGYSERPLVSRLPVSGSLRRGGTSGIEFSQSTLRSKSFGGRFLAAGGQPNPFHRPTVSPGSASGHGVAMGIAPAASNPTGSFTSGARSLLRQALSFNRRHGSFRGPSRAAAEAAAAAAGTVTAAVNAGGSGAAPGTTQVVTVTTMNASSAGLPTSWGSPGPSRYTGSYHNLPPDDDGVMPGEGAARHVTGEGMPLSSCESVTAGGGGSVGNSGKGGLLRSGLWRLARGAATSGSGGGVNKATSSSSGNLKTLPAVGASGTETSGPTALTLAMSSDGRRRRPIMGSCGGGGSGMTPYPMPGYHGAPDTAGGRSPVSSASGAYHRCRVSHTHGLYGDVVTGVAYGSGLASHRRMRSSYNGSLAGFGNVVSPTDASMEARVAAVSNTDGGGGGIYGCSGSQGCALATAYESEVTTGPLFTSIMGGESSNASGCVATDDARRLSNASAALMMDALETNGSLPRSVLAMHLPAPRVPQFRSALLLEGVRGDGGGLSLAALGRANIRRCSAPADVGATTVSTVDEPTALPRTPPAPSDPETYGAGSGGSGRGRRIADTLNGGEALVSSGIGRFGGRGSIRGSAVTVSAMSTIVDGEQPSLGRRIRMGSTATATPRLERPSIVVTHNQLYGAEADSQTHVRLGSGELLESGSIKVLLQDDDMVPDACGSALRDIGKVAAATNSDAAGFGNGGALTAAKELEAPGAAASVAEASSPLPASLEVAGTGSGRDEHKTVSTTAVGSESIGIISSGNGGPRSFLMLPFRPGGSPAIISPTINAGSSRSAALARLMRTWGREGRVHSSPTAHSSALDGDAAAIAGPEGGRASRVGAGLPAHIHDTSAPVRKLKLHPQARGYSRWHPRVSRSETAPNSSPLLRAEPHTAAAAGASQGRSAGQLQGVGVGGIGSYHRGSAGGITTSPVVGESPPASRATSMTFGPLSQTVVRGWSRANSLVRQLTRDRSVSKAARRSSTTENTALNTPAAHTDTSGTIVASATGGDDRSGCPAAGSGLASSAASGILVATSARLGGSDAEPDSGAELSAIGILADGLRSRVAAGSVSASGAMSKLHALHVPSAGAPGSGDEGPPALGDAEGGGRHRLSARIVTIDLGAALAAASADDDISMLPLGTGSTKSPDRLTLVTPPHDSKLISAAKLLATPDGSGRGGGGGAGGGGGKRGGGSHRGRTASDAVGPSSAPPQSLTAAYIGVASRRISFLGLGLTPRSRTVERRSSTTEEWQTGQADVNGQWLGASVSQTGAQSQPQSAVVVDCRSWRERCREDWPPALRPAPPARCAYRGLRVRMGLHTGITTASDVTFNPTTSHMAYSGTAIKVVKAVGDAAAGGMILMSQSTFQALVPIMMDLPGSPQAVFSGESDLNLGSDAGHYSFYQLVHREMVQRIGYSAPLRNISLTQLGTEDAPTGFCAISFMHVASASMLVAELGQPGVEALQQFKSIATGLCSRCGGYVVEASEGLCLAAFRHPAAALVWALASREALAAHQWSAEVRRWYRFAFASGSHSTSRGGRGPRPRTGVHVGGVNLELNATTGRMTYRGKVMNRTSRIAHKATSEQILCSKEAWDAVEDSMQRMVAEIQEEHRLEQEARREAAAAATRDGTTCSTVECDGVGNGDNGYADDDMVTALGGNGGPGSAVNSLQALSPNTHTGAGLLGSGMSGGNTTITSNHVSPASTRGGGVKNSGRGGSGVFKTGSAPSSLRSTLAAQEGAISEGFGRIKTSSLAASLAASVRAHRSASAKHLSAAAAAAAAALSRRVTSFTTRASSNSLPEILPTSGPGGQVNLSIPGPAPSASVGPASGRGSSSVRVLATVATANPQEPVPSSPTRLVYGVPHEELTSPTAASPNPVIFMMSGSVGGSAVNALGAAPQGAPPPAVVSNLPLALQSVTSEPGPAGGGIAVEGDANGGDATTSSVCATGPPPPSLQGQALSRLVGPKVQLPAAKRLEARFLGSYSLKGVREQMKLLEVFWADEEITSTANGGTDRGGCGADGGGSAIRYHGSSKPAGPTRGMLGFVANVTSLEVAAAVEAVAPDPVTSVAPPPSLGRWVPRRTAAAASPTLGFTGTGDTANFTTAAAAAALPIEARPVALSSVEFFRLRSGKSEWPTETTVYDDDVNVLQPDDAPDPKETAPVASTGPMPTFREMPNVAVTASVEVLGEGGRDGDSHQLKRCDSSGLSLAVGPVPATIPELEPEQESGNGDLEGGAVGRGNDSMRGSGLRSAHGSNGWPPQRQLLMPSLLSPPELQPASPSEKDQSGPGQEGAAPESGASSMWPVPSVTEDVSTAAHVGPYLIAPSRQQHQNFVRSPSLLQPHSRQRSVLKPELIFNSSGSGHVSLCSPSPGASPRRSIGSAGGAGDVSTGSNGSSRRRHQTGSLGVTFANPPLREPNQAQAHSLRGVLQHAVSTATTASRSRYDCPFQPGDYTGHLDIGAGGSVLQFPAAAAPEPATNSASAALTRPLSAPTTVRVQQPHRGMGTRHWVQPHPQAVRGQPAGAWQPVPAIDTCSRERVSGALGMQLTPPSLLPSNALEPGVSSPSLSDGMLRSLQSLRQEQHVDQPSLPYGSGTAWEVHPGEFAQVWEGELRHIQEGVPVRRTSPVGIAPAVAAATANPSAAAASASLLCDGRPIVVATEVPVAAMVPMPPPTLTATLEIEEVAEVGEELGCGVDDGRPVGAYAGLNR